MSLNALLKKLIREESKAIVEGVVKSVDGLKSCVVAPADGGANYSKVRLRSLIDANDTGLIIVPKVGSNCLVGFIRHNENNPVLISCDEVDKYLLNVDGGGSVEVDNQGNIVLNGGQFGGVVKVAELVQKLNTLESDLNTLKTVFTGWTPVPNDGGAALKAAATTWFGQQLSTTVEDDLKNDAVTHG